MTKPTTLYRFTDTAGQLLYVGITNRGSQRWQEHAKTKPWWHDVATATVEHYPTREQAEAAERAAIRAEHPTHNVAHATKVAGDRSASIPTVNDWPEFMAVGEAVAIRAHYQDFPAVGIITALSDFGIRLDLYSWLSCLFTGKTKIIRWDDVIEVLVADVLERGPGPSIVFDMDPLADFQTEHNARRIAIEESN